MNFFALLKISVSQVQRTESIPLKIATMRDMRNPFPSSTFKVTSTMALANSALESRISRADWLVNLKGHDVNLIFLQICNLYTII